jgi:predicted Rossmann fold flavoprotein
VRNSPASDCLIIGGGAAGLATAIFAARRNPNYKITVLDGAKRLGAKILISGGGRCNVTNDVVTQDDFWGGSRNVIRRVLAAFPAQQTVEFFREIGVSLHVEPGGKLFPDSNKARTVLEALVREAAARGATIQCDSRVTAIERDGDRFAVTTPAGAYCAKNVVLATGGRSVPKTGSDGTGYRLAESLNHSLIPQTPALVSLVLAGDFHTPLAGITQDVQLVVRRGNSDALRLDGPMLWTHFGVSGPVVLNASRHWYAAQLEQQSVTISVNFFGGDDVQAADSRLQQLATNQPRQALRNALGTLVPARVADAILAVLNMPPDIRLGQVPRETRLKLAHELTNWELNVRDGRGYQYAEATAGGVPLYEIDPATMESRKCSGLYFAGEILDVDGRIGGFNFQWAWSSAWVAAYGLGRGS